MSDSQVVVATTPDIHAERILIIDFGGQTTQLIARRVRECSVYSEIHPWHVTDDAIDAFAPSGVILSGGPESTLADNSPRIPERIFQLGIPVLGICYGMQAMVAQLGGKVSRDNRHGEFGYAQMRVVAHDRLLADLHDVVDTAATPALIDQSDANPVAPQASPTLDVWMSHGDRVVELPGGFALTGVSDNAPFAAMADDEHKRYGIQFHPEVTHTRQGAVILERFVRDICGCRGLWTPGNIVDDAIAHVRQQLGQQKVLLGLSGGVDSSVLAALLHRAVGNQLTCVFVDTGLLRLDEGDQVMQTFHDNMGVRVIRVNAEVRFMKALEGVCDPELLG